MWQTIRNVVLLAYGFSAGWFLITLVLNGIVGYKTAFLISFGIVCSIPLAISIGAFVRENILPYWRRRRFVRKGPQ